MTASQILTICVQIILTGVVAVAAWGVKSALGDMKKAIDKNNEQIEKVDARQTQEVEKLKTQLSDLKSDLPLVYVLREDFIRTLNNVDRNMSSMDGKLDRLLTDKCKKEA